MKRLALLLLLGLGGCAGQAWVRDGVPPETVKQDLAECRGEARSATARDTAIENDIMASRGQDWERNGEMSTKTAGMTAADQGRTADIVGSCMTGKGYVQARSR